MTKRLLVTCVVLAGLQAPSAHGMWMLKKAKNWFVGEKKEQPQQTPAPMQPVVQPQPEETVEVMSLRGTTLFTVPKSQLKGGVKKIAPQPVITEITALQVVATPVLPVNSQALNLSKPLSLLSEEEENVIVTPAQPLPSPTIIHADIPELTDSTKALVPYVCVKEVVKKYYSSQKPTVCPELLKEIICTKLVRDAFNSANALQPILNPGLTRILASALAAPTQNSDLEDQEINRLSSIDNNYQLPENWHPEDHYTEYTAEQYAAQRAEQAAAEKEEISRLSNIETNYKLPKNWHRAQFNKEFPCPLTAHGDSTTPKRKAPKLSFIPNPNYEGHLALLHGTCYQCGDFE